MEVVTQALQSLPPAQASTATARIIASMHPPAPANDVDAGTTIQFVGVDTAPWPEAADAPSGPVAPDGTPLKQSER
jgi:hypothetical protein